MTDAERERGGLNDYTLVHGRMRCPARGKLKSTERQLLLLRRRRIVCHCIGGLSMHDKDLQKLVKAGLMKFVRVPYAAGWGGDYALRRTVAVITAKGEATLAHKGTDHDPQADR